MAAQNETCGTAANGIWRCVAGSGGVTIVLNAGARLTSATWDPLVEDLMAFGAVVRFDRPGLGRSPPVEGPRTPRAIANDVAAMVDELAVSRSLILVGHSAGGYHLLRFAADRPETVLGVVLIDTPHPNFDDRRLALLTEQQRHARKTALAASRAAASLAVRAEYAGAEQDGALDFTDYPALLPLMVITADQQDFGYPDLAAMMRLAWAEEQAEWLTLSAASRLIVAQGASHSVHRERPDLVVDAVRAIVDRASDDKPR
ncbi:MAG: alpha/beta hydrolase [Pseudomonadota bacterium]